MNWNQYKRKGLSEMRPYTSGEDISNVSVSEPDLQNGSPKQGDMIARNPKNHADQWLVARKYFEDNLEINTATAETVQTGGDQAVAQQRLVLDSWVLQERNHDRYTKEWSEWEDVVGRKLRDKFGANPEEWKEACKMWIDVGGRYEFRIFKRVDTEDWSIRFSSENA